MTLSFSEAGFMIEKNVIAAPIIYSKSVTLIVSYKLFVIGVGLAIMVRFRDRITVEMSCWFILGVLVILFIRWIMYIDAINMLSQYSGLSGKEIDEQLEEIRKTMMANDLDPNSIPMFPLHR